MINIESDESSNETLIWRFLDNWLFSPSCLRMSLNHTTSISLPLESSRPYYEATFSPDAQVSTNHATPDNLPKVIHASTDHFPNKNIHATGFVQSPNDDFLDTFSEDVMTSSNDAATCSVPKSTTATPPPPPPAPAPAPNTDLSSYESEMAGAQRPIVDSCSFQEDNRNSLIEGPGFHNGNTSPPPPPTGNTSFPPNNSSTLYHVTSSPESVISFPDDPQSANLLSSYANKSSPENQMPTANSFSSANQMSFSSANQMSFSNQMSSENPIEAGNQDQVEESQVITNLVLGTCFTFLYYFLTSSLMTEKIN